MTRFLALILGFLSLPGWAAEVQAPGIPHFHAVNDHVYRGGQPKDNGWKSLADLGVKTVVDLRGRPTGVPNAEQRAAQMAGMRYVNVPLKAIGAPSNEEMARILSVLDSEVPVFVHCQLGEDRTGTVIACYRIAHDRWSNQKALQEALSLGFHGFERAMKQYILSFQPPARPAIP